MTATEFTFLAELEKKYAGNNGFTDFEMALLKITYAAGMSEAKPALNRCYEWLCTGEAMANLYHRESKQTVEEMLLRIQSAEVESNRIKEIELNA